MGRRTKAGCSRACQEAVSSWEEGKRCYGFTYNTATNNCTLFYDFGYELTNIGTEMESMHYRRTFTCSKYCLSTSNIAPGGSFITNALGIGYEKTLLANYDH